MNPQSLTIIFSDPLRIEMQNSLQDDDVATEIGGAPVFAGTAPWGKMHDLLVDRETRTWAGIVYPVAAQEEAAVAAICQSLPAEVVRYCISPARAAAVLSNPQLQLTETINETSDQNLTVKRFPNILRPFRQIIRSCLLGESELNELPEEIRTAAAQYLEDASAAEWTSETARVEVTWTNKPVNAQLPGYFPSAFDVEPAQYFAEDIWFYRQDNGQVYGIGINHLDETLASYDLRLPEDF